MVFDSNKILRIQIANMLTYFSISTERMNKKSLVFTGQQSRWKRWKYSTALFLLFHSKDRGCLLSGENDAGFGRLVNNWE